MLHLFYVEFMLWSVGRKPRAGEPVYSRLEACRTAHEMSRTELADAVEVHYQTIGHLERGEYSVLDDDTFATLRTRRAASSTNASWRCATGSTSRPTAGTPA